MYIVMPKTATTKTVLVTQRKGKERERNRNIRTGRNSQKASNKMEDLYANILIITLKTCNLNMPIKKTEIGKMHLKKKTHLYAAYKKFASNIINQAG